MKNWVKRLAIAIVVVSTLIQSPLSAVTIGGKQFMGPIRAAKCLFEPKKWNCSKKEIKEAKKWAIGVSLATLTLAAAAIGIGAAAAARAKGGAVQSTAMTDWQVRADLEGLKTGYDRIKNQSVYVEMQSMIAMYEQQGWDTQKLNEIFDGDYKAWLQNNAPSGAGI